VNKFVQCGLMYIEALMFDGCCTDELGVSKCSASERNLPMWSYVSIVAECRIDECQRR
jgi:hypothetical protein